MTIQRYLTLAAAIFLSSIAFASPRYAIIKEPTPIMTVADFHNVFGGKDGMTLSLNKCGLIKEVGYIALPGAVFAVHHQVKFPDHIAYAVSSVIHPLPKGSYYFIDSRFLDVVSHQPAPVLPAMPSAAGVLHRIKALLGSIYVWGGNAPGGIPKLMSYYPPSQPIEKGSLLEKRWMLNGIDCSGILYSATNGLTPRGSGTLLAYGQPVAIRGLTASQIAHTLKPLDLIVWKGHVMIVFDKHHLIESRPDFDDDDIECADGGDSGGVYMRNLVHVIKDTMKTRVPVNAYSDTMNGKKTFVVRRWHPEEL